MTTAKNKRNAALFANSTLYNGLVPACTLRSNLAKHQVIVASGLAQHTKEKLACRTS